MIVNIYLTIVAQTLLAYKLLYTNMLPPRIIFKRFVGDVFMGLVIKLINTYLFGPALPIIVFLIGSAMIIKYASFVVFKPKKIIKGLMKKESGDGMSPFKSAMLALASTLGVGNIVGVATAIYSGGAGAVFWSGGSLRL